jgi:hypothetical protein
MKRSICGVVCGLLAVTATAWAEDAGKPGGLGAAGQPVGVGRVEQPAERPKIEVNCSDRKDDDGDGLADCADADCAKDEACKVGNGPENSAARCSDWFDNDGDGFVDCDDAECEQTPVCKGSWVGPVEGPGHGAAMAEMPDLAPGQEAVDLVGKGRDKDGERSDEVCSDGIDNDDDGKIDCADFGCRFDPEVTVCNGNPGMRFSIVAQVTGEMTRAGNTEDYGKQDAAGKDVVPWQYDAGFAKLQLRSFGPVNGIANSFYLISMRAEQSPRMSFAMFQMPLGRSGHFLNINSGGGGLSTALIISTSRLLLLDPATYMYKAFEQGNGAAAEVFGPLTPDYRFFYRTFVAAGSGRSNGNVGGRYFTFDNTNFTYSLGGQIGWNVVGRVNRFDSPFLYVPVPLTFGITVGAKYDQRAQERYPAWNVNAVLRYKRLVVIAENYGKKELNFGSLQNAFNVQAGVLLWPKKLLLAADFGQYHADRYENLPPVLETDLKAQVKVPDEQQWRVALHYYFWKSIGVFSIRYRDRRTEGVAADSKIRLDAVPARHEQDLIGSVQYRF